MKNRKKKDFGCPGRLIFLGTGNLCKVILLLADFLTFFPKGFGVTIKPQGKKLRS
jgi:hypothetical protein